MDFLSREDHREFAIKKFKPDREGDTHHYVGISQSACREIAVRWIYQSMALLQRAHSWFVSSYAESSNMRTLSNLKKYCWRIRLSTWCSNMLSMTFW